MKKINKNEFVYCVENYNKVKDLILKGYNIDKVRELTGLSEDAIKKYEFIVKSHYLIIDFDKAV